MDESGISIEEGYVYWTSLPGHFRLDIGKFRQQVGELNRWHRHALPEGEYPLVLQRYLGEDGLAQTGLSVYWPLPFSGALGTFEFTGQVTTGTDQALFGRYGGRPSVLGQLSGFWQFSRSTFGQLSVTALYGTGRDSTDEPLRGHPPGPCPLQETRIETALRALAARFTWRPPNEALRREVTVRGELFQLHRLVDGSGPSRLGWYVDAQTKLGLRWTAAVRYDRVESPDPAVAGSEWAVDAVADLLAERVRLPPRPVDAPPGPPRHHHGPRRPPGRLGDGSPQARALLMPTPFVALLTAAGLLAGGPLPPSRPLPPSGPVKVVTTQTTYAAIAREILGDRGTASSIGQGDEDPHFIQPRPSFVPALRDADVFVTTGMDLEMWVPALLDRANNGNVREGGRGYVAAFQGVPLMEVPTSVSRSQGDIHVDGNPHLQGDPINAIIIARNILAGLTRVSPENAAVLHRAGSTTSSCGSSAPRSATSWCAS